MNKRCRICGKEFTPYRNRRVYCSKECTSIRRVRDPFTKECKYCKIQFSTTQNRQVFCSSKCRLKHKGTTCGQEVACIDCGKAHDSRGKRCIVCSRKEIVGDKNPNWKGGRLSDRYGYVKVYKPSHKRSDYGGYIYEHWEVWETVNSRQLPEGWVIHHINGIRNDNRIDNLYAMPIKCHHAKLFTMALQERIRKLEKEVDKMKLQGRFDDL